MLPKLDSIALTHLLHAIKSSIESDAPLNRSNYRGFQLQIVGFKRNTLLFVLQLLGKPLRAFCKPAPPQSARPIASLSCAEQRRLFKKIRIDVMREVRQKNMAIFAEELQLSGIELSKAMKAIDPAYDKLYAGDFDFAYANTHRADEDEMAALWAAHAATSPLCESPLACYAWQYSAAMETEAIAGEIERLLEKHCKKLGLPGVALQASGTTNPYADNPPWTTRFSTSA